MCTGCCDLLGEEFNDWQPADGIWQVRMYQETVSIIDNLVPVTIGAVDGVCTGGGLELTLVRDFVLARPRSRWGMSEINWDITPGCGQHRQARQVRWTAQGEGVEPHRGSVQRDDGGTAQPRQPPL